MSRSISTSKRIGVLGIGLVLALAATTASYASDNLARTYEVKITNLMTNNQLTPILAAVHSSRVSPIFEVGETPTDGLAAVAEGGDTSLLTDELDTRRNSTRVGAVGTFTPDSGPLTFGGATLVFTIQADQPFRFMSLASMVLPTNDTFMALDSVRLPTRQGLTNTYYAAAYDAGSETNDELCINIPGPTCGGDGAFIGINGEGTVSPSNGIQGNGDLDPSVYDFDTNNVAKIEVTRTN